MSLTKKAKNLFTSHLAIQIAKFRESKTYKTLRNLAKRDLFRTFYRLIGT